MLNKSKGFLNFQLSEKAFHTERAVWVQHSGLFSTSLQVRHCCHCYVESIKVQLDMLWRCVRRISENFLKNGSTCGMLPELNWD